MPPGARPDVGGRACLDAAWRNQAGGIEWLEEDAGDGAQPHELALLQRMYA